ncbi:hypothetical protein [Tardiphaga sp.]|uniref:hypothetical protein n=1 Tax=Tardiphaga sp. TaxID=1926292 RepID=UPI0037DA5AD0
MSKTKRFLVPEFETPVYPDQEEDEREEQREASTLLSFVVISLFIGIACGWAGILSGRI